MTYPYLTIQELVNVNYLLQGWLKECVYEITFTFLKFILCVSQILQSQIKVL